MNNARVIYIYILFFQLLSRILGDEINFSLFVNKNYNKSSLLSLP